jgi:hypothetical protein
MVKVRHGEGSATHLPPAQSLAHGLPEARDHVLDAVARAELDAHAGEGAALDADARELLLVEAEERGGATHRLARDGLDEMLARGIQGCAPPPAFFAVADRETVLIVSIPALIPTTLAA